MVAFEDLKVANMVKNHHLAKSISDAAWRLFREWLEYFGKVFGVPVIAVPPHNANPPYPPTDRRGAEVASLLLLPRLLSMW